MARTAHLHFNDGSSIEHPINEDYPIEDFLALVERGKELDAPLSEKEIPNAKDVRYFRNITGVEFKV